MANQELVEEFHRKLGRFVSETQRADPPEEIRALRNRLHDEELSELHAAMDKGGLIGVADRLADCLYVLYGTAVSYGIALDEVLRRVHRSEMTKSRKTADRKTELDHAMG